MTAPYEHIHDELVEPVAIGFRRTTNHLLVVTRTPAGGLQTEYYGLLRVAAGNHTRLPKESE